MVELEEKHAEYLLTVLCAMYGDFGQFAGPAYEEALNALAASLYGQPLYDENGYVT